MAAEIQKEDTAYPNVKRTFSPAPAGTTTAPAPAAGLVIQLDAKGRPTADTKAVRGAVTIPSNNNSQIGLTARKVTLKDGKSADITDLQGRFHAYSVATIGADGKANIGCIEPNDAPTSGCKEHDAK